MSYCAGLLGFLHPLGFWKTREGSEMANSVQRRVDTPSRPRGLFPNVEGTQGRRSCRYGRSFAVDLPERLPANLLYVVRRPYLTFPSPRPLIPRRAARLLAFFCAIMCPPSRKFSRAKPSPCLY